MTSLLLLIWVMGKYSYHDSHKNKIQCIKNRVAAIIKVCAIRTLAMIIINLISLDKYLNLKERPFKTLTSRFFILIDGYFFIIYDKQ